LHELVSEELTREIVADHAHVDHFVAVVSERHGHVGPRTAATQRHVGWRIAGGRDIPRGLDNNVQHHVANDDDPLGIHGDD
jgi:hypothetical protein